ncbi:hypothetical protein jhhlp_007588 [Lomentospora prolificans]|uniref:RNA ligase/cyclic nucleotide phosphodiesterase n=1 Tax=Lomentospora prolificans TaxID=41688 RepID=A0A2N3N003_9PEZI|nr:hypothetical protein jhhlp_007588 [Lomentospora prolificans]
MAQTSPDADPFSELISKCDTPSKMQHAYATHRLNRAAQQSSLFLSPAFPGVTKDHYLSLTEFSKTGKHPSGEPLDPRNSLVLWGRPPEHVLKLAGAIQARLKLAAPNLWLMPLQRMHITIVEIAFCKSPQEITHLLGPLRPHLPTIVNHAYSHRARLVKPMVAYDSTGLALTFLPAAGEQPRASRDPDPAGVPALAPSNPEHLRSEPVDDDVYTYHHLRQDVYEMIRKFSPDPPEPRYQLPSAHVTLGRYLTQDDHSTPEKREAWVAVVDGINRWLEEEVWTGRSEFVGEWVVGHEKGLEMRAGMVWYGGGRTIMAGEGF